MLSKELLGKILNFNVSSSEVIGNEILVIFEDGDRELYNIYGVANKCKIWSAERGYYIMSSLGKYPEGLRWYSTFRYVETFKDGFTLDLEEWFNSENEPEAIFKATQWIYERAKETNGINR